MIALKNIACTATKIVCATTLTLGFFATHALAAPADDAAQAAASQEISRVTLEGEGRNDMKAHFAYAQRSLKKHNAREAEWAFRKMLANDPSLDRVRLDLAMVLIPQGKLAEAKALLLEVKDKNPPASVVKNINLVLAQVTMLMKPHQLNGSVSVGINSDSNANASPSSGDITLLDTSIPLGAGAGKQHDISLYTAASINHVYRTDLDQKSQTLRWKTDFLNYRTLQDKLSNLNIIMNTIRTGPELTLLDSGMKLGLFGSYSMLTLDSHKYLDNPKLNAVVEVPLTNDLTVSFDSSVEHRTYHNAPGVTTYEDRDGSALQQTAGLRYILSDQWLLNSTVTARKEEAKQNYYGNEQYAIDFGTTYIINPQTFVTAQTGYRHSNYDEADLLTSAKIRSDDEYSAGLTIGRIFLLPELGNQATLTGGYLYRRVDSNLQNYDYDNHRISTSLSIAF